jgi:transposase InsO family protein
MAAQKKYPDELRERAVKMLFEVREREGRGRGELARVARQLGVHPEALDALEMAIWVRRDEDLGGLVHHSDRGVQYTSIRYAERLAEERAVRSVGSKGDSYDNAAAEALNSLYKRELIDPKKDWRGVDDVMLATMDWVQWYNEDRIHSYSGDMPPKSTRKSIIGPWELVN